MTPTFQGEVQLRRWSESSTQGVQVTFALADADDLEPLKIKSGKRFMAVLVEINDDETPVQPQGEPIGPLCKWLVLRCKEPEFWAWLTNAYPKHDFQAEAHATEFVRHLLNIRSRKDLDVDRAAEERFHELIRHPYQKWLVRRSG